MTVLAKFISLPRSEKWLLLLTAPLVVSVRVALWVLPSAVIVRATRRIANTQTDDRAQAAVSIASIVRFVQAVSHRVPDASCLTQALSAQLLLHWYGYSSRLCLGVALGAGKQFRAHAWLERDNQILIGGAAHGFTRLPDLGATLGGSPLRRQP